MNHPFIQMLKFEAKSNRKMWIITTAIGVALLALTNLANSSLFKPLSFYLLFFITLVITLLSYQESTNKQSMSMYHLIPVDKSVKFAVKIVISLIVFPLLFLMLYELFTFLGSLLHRFDRQSGNNTIIWDLLLSQNLLKVYLVFWLFSQSLSTLLAIVFKKFKVLYAMLVFYGLQILIAPIFALVTFVSKNGPELDSPNRHPSNPLTWVVILAVVASIVLYGISYRLFIRRKL